MHFAIKKSNTNTIIASQLKKRKDKKDDRGLYNYMLRGCGRFETKN